MIKLRRVNSLEEYIEVLKSKLGEAKGNYKRALELRDCGMQARYFRGKIETLESVISNLEKLQSKDKSE